MKAQLMLQFKTGEDLHSFDQLIRFGEQVIAIARETAEVDGHGFGSKK